MVFPLSPVFGSWQGSGTFFVLPLPNLGDMKITAVVLHKGSLAHYTVSEKRDGSFEARLLRYGGKDEDAPPGQVWFVKDGRHCTGSTKHQELMDELCAAVQWEKEKRGGDVKKAA